MPKNNAFYKYKQSQNQVFNPNSVPQQQQKAADKYKNPKNEKIVVTVQPGKIDLKTKQPYNLLNLYNVDVDSAKEIVARLSDPSKQRTTLKAWIDKTEPTHVCISVLQSQIDDWLDGSDLNSIQSILLKSGKYDNNEVKQLEDKIATGFVGQDKDKLKQIANDAMENSLTMWQKYLSKINDPIERKQIELYSRVYRIIKYVDENGVERNLGNILSAKNAALIRSYYPDATFVLGATLWRDVFNRGIKRGAKPIPYFMLNTVGKGDVQSFQKAQAENGWGDKKKTEIPRGALNQIRMDAEEKGDGYHMVWGYDVRDTYLLSGAKDDPFNTQEGLLNNLTGELNAIAKQKFKRNDNDKQIIDGEDEMKARTEKACLWAEQNLPQSGYTIKSSYQDASNKLADYVYTYCKDNATKKTRFLSETNVNTYAQNATKITLILTNLALDALSRFGATYEYSKPEAKALMSIVWVIASELEKNAVLTEGLYSWLTNKADFVKRFLKILKQIGCGIKNTPYTMNQSLQNPINNEEQPNSETKQQNDIDTVRNNFNNYFNKINKDYFTNEDNRF